MDNRKLTDDSLTYDKEHGAEVAREAGAHIVEQTKAQAKTMARNVGDQARSMAAAAGSTAQDLARRAGEQVSMAGDTLYQQGARAGEYLARNVNEYPLTALLIAGAVGYGLAYLVHSSWQMSSSTDQRERQADRRHRD
jgi:ElaB/YqjD/DUF883 family membrane-anchored ribosome-binding protein